MKVSAHETNVARKFIFTDVLMIVGKSTFLSTNFSWPKNLFLLSRWWSWSKIPFYQRFFLLEISFLPMILICMGISADATSTMWANKKTTVFQPRNMSTQKHVDRNSVYVFCKNCTRFSTLVKMKVFIVFSLRTHKYMLLDSNLNPTDFTTINRTKPTFRKEIVPKRIHW